MASIPISNINPLYPSTEDLRMKAKSRIPKFAFEYLDGGCNEEINLCLNTEDIRRIQFKPDYLSQQNSFNQQTDLFGHTYSSPFGIAPIGLQGLMWPNAPIILARAAKQHNIPFILSTVSTASIEQVAKVTDGAFWFQLYYPSNDEVRNDIIVRAWRAGCKVLVLLCDTPTFGYRVKDIKGGLSMPPSMSLKNILQICAKPAWAIETLKIGIPQFKTLTPYMGNKTSMKKTGEFMNETFSGRLTEDRIEQIRKQWKGKLILKGVASEQDAERAIKLGLDGIIVSNHGGRQIDVGESAIKSLQRIIKYENKIKIMMDSGVRSGTDIARVLGSGSCCAFLGRTFMYSIAALGKKGGNHAISMLKKQLQIVLEQLGCSKTTNLKNYIIK